MVRLRGGAKREQTSPLGEIGDEIKAMDVEDDNARDGKKRHKIGDQTDSFAEMNTKNLLKLLEDGTKCVGNLVELERIKEGNKVLVRDRDMQRRVAEKKPEIQKKDMRVEACISKPALQPSADELARAKAEARKKILPCPRCESLNTRFEQFKYSNLRKEKRLCRDCKRSWIVGGKLRRGGVNNSLKLGLVPL
ncbi:uncharacterized protein LOC126627007 isoform X2 [Malus sylvestris]|uniref:uncharacterized protein LOC126627007 isoform X2 n=1 Tax=Malus sylvestris TaxID=3752 RepID=UPI0021ABC93E|nr:uncharacterized protein LOC126627007 isoform X2 [Malus sylvestris]